MKILAIISLLAGISLNAGINEIPNSQSGGICFRMDDNQNPQKWRDIANVFNKHNVKFGASLNIRTMTNDNKKMLKQLQEEGHEIMDHSPMHNIMKFKFAPGKTVEDYKKLPGVDHISGNTVYLTYLEPDPKDCIAVLKAKLQKDKLVLVNPPDEKLAKMIRNAKVLYIPDGKWVFQLCRTYKADEFKLRSVWGEKNVDEKTQELKVCFLGDRAFSITPDALELLGRNSLDLFAALGAKRPYTWIQPGGGVSCISSELAKDVLGKRLGYKSAATYVQQSLKVFNEYNPKGACAYGMMWGDFDEERHDLKWNKTRIADLVALHHIAIGHSHMHPKDGWDKYLHRLDQLLAWCADQKIPVRTQMEWAEILYPSKSNAEKTDFDIFPSLKIDRDGNGRPDGYSLGRSSWQREKSAIVSCKQGELFAVKNLGGLHKGGNRLSFSIDPDKNCRIKVSVRFPKTKFPSQEKLFTYSKAGKQNSKWDFIIPEEASTADFSWSMQNKGHCVISKISLQKKRL